MKSKARRLLESIGYDKILESLNGFTIITNQTRKDDFLLPSMVYPSKEDAMNAAKELIKKELLPKESWRIVEVKDGKRKM